MRRISFFFSSRRRHTRLQGDWSSDVCSSDLRKIIVLRFSGTVLRSNQDSFNFRNIDCRYWTFRASTHISHRTYLYVRTSWTNIKWRSGKKVGHLDKKTYLFTLPCPCGSLSLNFFCTSWKWVRHFSLRIDSSSSISSRDWVDACERRLDTRDITSSLLPIWLLLPDGGDTHRHVNISRH